MGQSDPMGKASRPAHRARRWRGRARRGATGVRSVVARAWVAIDRVGWIIAMVFMVVVAVIVIRVGGRVTHVERSRETNTPIVCGALRQIIEYLADRPGFHVSPVDCAAILRRDK